MEKICKTGLPGFFGSSPASSLSLRLQNSETQADPLWNVVLKDMHSVCLWTGAKDTGQRTNVHSQPLPSMQCTASAMEALGHTKEDMSSLATLGPQDALLLGLFPGRRSNTGGSEGCCPQSAAPLGSREEEARRPLVILMW